jgi:hypothetical protein
MKWHSFDVQSAPPKSRNRPDVLQLGWLEWSVLARSVLGDDPGDARPFVFSFVSFHPSAVPATEPFGCAIVW